MDRVVYHISFRQELEQWESKRVGAFRATMLAPTKQEVVKVMAERIGDRKAQLVIHNQNGQIEEERTFPRSSDPRGRKG